MGNDIALSSTVVMLLIVGWKWNLCEKKLNSIKKWNCLNKFTQLEVDWGETGPEAPFVSLAVPRHGIKRCREEHACVSEHRHRCLCVRVYVCWDHWAAETHTDCTVLLPHTGERQEIQLMKAWLAIHCHEGYGGEGGGHQLKRLVAKHLPCVSPCCSSASCPKPHYSCVLLNL